MRRKGRRWSALDWSVHVPSDKKTMDQWGLASVRYHLFLEPDMPLRDEETRRYLTERLPFLVLAEAAGPPREKP